MSGSSTITRERVEAQPIVDHAGADWSQVERASYVLRQFFRYDYPSGASHLRHRLMVVPPAVHGDQRCRAWWVDCSEPAGRRRHARDSFGNRVIDLEVAHVGGSIVFESCVAVERRRGSRPHRVAADAVYLQRTPLTRSDRRIGRVAVALRKRHGDGLGLAEAICSWVHEHVAYSHDVTGVDTTAAQALAIGAGVCQDYAHIMVSMCRRAGLPARYVSGHLLGEGGSHAWVEALVPDPDRTSGWLAEGFDPTHGGRTALGHLTIAIGRDYRDVAPTSGTYRADRPGTLSASKRVGLVEATYRS